MFISEIGENAVSHSRSQHLFSKVCFAVQTNARQIQKGQGLRAKERVGKLRSAVAIRRSCRD